VSPTCCDEYDIFADPARPLSDLSVVQGRLLRVLMGENDWRGRVTPGRVELHITRVLPMFSLFAPCNFTFESAGFYGYRIGWTEPSTNMAGAPDLHAAVYTRAVNVSNNAPQLSILWQKELRIMGGRIGRGHMTSRDEQSGPSSLQRREDREDSRTDAEIRRLQVDHHNPWVFRN